MTNSAPKHWERRLAAYIAGGAAVLAAQDAQAAVIYSGVQDLAVGTNSKVDVDLNGDGIVDFSLENALNGGSGFQELLLHTPSTSAVAGFAFMGFSAPTPISPGEAVPGMQKMLDGARTDALASSDPTFGTPWVGFSNALLGLEFQDSGAQTFYGWARLSVAGSADPTLAATATIHDWAYNDVAGQGIAAGTLEPVPEPGSLALLAAGSAGLGAFRARRRRRAESAAQEQL